MISAARAKGLVVVGVAERALMSSGGGGARFFELDDEIAMGVETAEEVGFSAEAMGSLGPSIGVGGSRVTVPTRPARSSSVMFAVRSRLSRETKRVSRGREGVCWLVVLSSVGGMYMVSRGREEEGWPVLSSVVLPPPPFELSTASSDETPVSPF